MTANLKKFLEDEGPCRFEWWWLQDCLNKKCPYIIVCCFNNNILCFSRRTAHCHTSIRCDVSTHCCKPTRCYALTFKNASAVSQTCWFTSKLLQDMARLESILAAMRRCGAQLSQSFLCMHTILIPHVIENLPGLRHLHGG